MRVKAVISRHHVGLNDNGGHEIFEAEGLHIDFTARAVSIDGKKIDLTPKDYDLLFYMVKNRGIALTRN